nr:hypothetical protein CFP56_56696 [Quercus suber]POF10830.1 hypothetical protein CFP56_03498 [Quercus suber]
MSEYIGGGVESVRKSGRELRGREDAIANFVPSFASHTTDENDNTSSFSRINSNMSSVPQLIVAVDFPIKNAFA